MLISSSLVTTSHPPPVAPHGSAHTISFHNFTESITFFPPPLAQLFSTSSEKLGCSQVTPVAYSSFLNYWEQEIAPFDEVERLFCLLKKPESDFMTTCDLIPLIQEVVDCHPALEILHAPEEGVGVATDSIDKYILTVVTRVFYSVNQSRTGKISLREFRHYSDLGMVLHQLDSNEDINTETKYFSYQHSPCYITHALTWILIAMVFFIFAIFNAIKDMH